MFTKKLAAVLSVGTLLFTLSSCACKHDWTEPTCTDPKTCTLCGEVEGEALEHTWKPATCTSPKICDNCSETEGEPIEHTWQEATCTSPKACQHCDKTEGQPIAHDWQDATTEEPKTCAACKLTEGEKLHVDSRFTTASTKDFYGTWTCVPEITGDMMELGGYLDILDCKLTMTFSNIGEFSTKIEVDEEAFFAALKQKAMDEAYANTAAMGFDKEQTDAAMMETYGMTVEEYTDSILAELTIDDYFGFFNEVGVYYVEDGLVYETDSWESEFEPSEFSFDDGKLTIDVLYLNEGEPFVWEKAE